MSKDKFYSNQEEPNKSCFLAMRHMLLEFDDKITETVKYGMPCFCVEGKPFCYLWSDKKTLEPYFLLVRGNELSHPSLESGTRAKMKILPVNPLKDLPVSVINEVFSAALKLYK